MKAGVLRSAIEVTDALAELGLSREIIIESVLEGESARNSCTANDPNCLPGIVAWGRTVRALRNRLLPQPHKWEKNDEDNFPTVVSPDGKIAVAVATGDEGTGKADATPKTKYAKGAAVEAVISRNLNSLFPAIREEAEAEKQKRDNRQTWILLKRREKGQEKDTVFAELSLPESMTEGEQVKRWISRILFDPITTDPNIEVQDDTASEPIDVPVRRRS